jgi:hypothetical protein
MKEASQLYLCGVNVPVKLLCHENALVIVDCCSSTLLVDLSSSKDSTEDLSTEVQESVARKIAPLVNL